MDNKGIIETLKEILINLALIFGQQVGNLASNFELIAKMVWAFIEGYKDKLSQSAFLSSLEQYGYIK